MKKNLYCITLKLQQQMLCRFNTVDNHPEIKGMACFKYRVNHFFWSVTRPEKSGGQF